MNADDIPIANQDSLNQENCSKQANKGDLYSQNGNRGISHMNGGVIKDKAKVAGEIEENNNSHNTNIQVNVNLDPQTESKSFQKPLNRSQNKKVLFEITISGELNKDKKAKYRDIQRKIEDIVDELSELGIKHELITKNELGKNYKI